MCRLANGGHFVLASVCYFLGFCDHFFSYNCIILSIHVHSRKLLWDLLAVTQVHSLSPVIVKSPSIMLFKAFSVASRATLTHWHLWDMANFDCKILRHISVTDIWIMSCGNALRWMPQDLIDDESLSIYVLDWCDQAVSHYLSQCWPRSKLLCDITGPQWFVLRMGDCIFSDIEMCPWQ